MRCSFVNDSVEWHNFDWLLTMGCHTDGDLCKWMPYVKCYSSMDRMIRSCYWHRSHLIFHSIPLLPVSSFLLPSSFRTCLHFLRCCNRPLKALSCSLYMSIDLSIVEDIFHPRFFDVEHFQLFWGFHLSTWRQHRQGYSIHQ